MDDFTPDQQLGQQPEPEQNAQHVPTPDVPYDNPPPQEGPTAVSYTHLDVYKRQYYGRYRI